MEKAIKTIGVLTSGGDAPGMNAAIRVHGIYDAGRTKTWGGRLPEIWNRRHCCDWRRRFVPRRAEAGGSWD